MIVKEVPAVMKYKITDKLFLNEFLLNNPEKKFRKLKSLFLFQEYIHWRICFESLNILTSLLPWKDLKIPRKIQ